jgi:hypothetical protein
MVLCKGNVVVSSWVLMQASRDKLVPSCRNQGCVRVALLITGLEQLAWRGAGRNYDRRLSAALNLFKGHEFRIYTVKSIHISKGEPSKIANPMMLL